MIRVLLDGIEASNQPNGVEKLTERLEMNDDLKIFGIEIVGNLTFFGEDFSMLFSYMKNDPCRLVKIEIQQKIKGLETWKSKFSGLVFVNDIDFDYDRRLAVCEIVDNSLVSRIINNANVSIDLIWQTTKNGFPISANYDNNVTVSDNSFNKFSNRRGILLYDAMVYVLGWITDSQIIFESDYLQNNPDANQYYLMSGRSLRSAIVKLPDITFTDLMLDLHKMFHLYGFVYENSSGQSVFKMEPYEYFESQTASVELKSLKNVVLTANQDAYVASVQMGSFKNTSEDASTGGLVPTVDDRWYIPQFNEYMAGWSKNDEIALTTQCNNPGKLDIRNQRIITDPNVISDVVNNQDSKSYDNDVFMLVDENGFVPLPLFPFDVDTGPSPIPLFGYFNDGVDNRSVLARWLSEICFTKPDYPVECEATAEVTSDYVLAVGAPAFDAKVDPCNYMESDGIGVNNRLGPWNGAVGGIFDITIKMIFENTTAGNINLTIRNVGYPSLDYADPTTGAYISYYNTDISLTTFIDPNGWSTFGYVYGDYATSVNRIVAPGEIVEYNALMRNVILYSTGIFAMSVLGIGLTLKAGSFWKVEPVLNRAFNNAQENSLCSRYPYQFEMAGFISDDEIGQIRANQFIKFLVQHPFRNFFGKRTVLERNIVTTSANVTMLSKTC